MSKLASRSQDLAAPETQPAEESFARDQLPRGEDAARTATQRSHQPQGHMSLEQLPGLPTAQPTAEQEHSTMQPSYAQITEEMWRIIDTERLTAQFRFLYEKDLQQRCRFTQPVQIYLEADCDIGEVCRDFARARAAYNLTLDPSVFHRYLPYRRTIAADPAKLEAYERLVRHILDHADIRFAETVIKLREFEQHPQAEDASLRYLFAASMVEGLHGRPDLIEKVLSRKKPFGVLIINSHPHMSGTFRRDNVLELHNGQWLYRMAVVPRRFNLALHEFAHGIDAVQDSRNGSLLLDGVLEQMEKEYAADGTTLLDRYTTIWESLSALTDYARLPANERAKAPELDEATGLPSYAFWDKREFLAETLRIFADDPHLFHAPGRNQQALPLKQQLYALYRQFLRFDPLIREQAADAVPR